ncbi:hypothetical protein [Fictibacillus arsenicus]|uniref:Uncharacterized protein n=1 Tax=Fictibacillus arsenicus TaxID=255247 RepID=A0A1V3G5T1_9BACL|nr:hypothetical protein [Fictibacillus arsenicus]OOE10826.1 hypothetical protein UN64_15895 [Fictibacillus arsenicus]
MKEFLDNVTFKNVLDVITVLIAIINVYLVVLVYKLTHRDVNPKLFVKPTIVEDGRSYARYSNPNVDSINFDQKGFPEIGHNSLLWGIEVHNNGELPATNIEIKLSITIHKSEFDDGEFLGDIENHRFVDYKVYYEVFNFDYIPPNSSVKKDFLSLLGDFPYATLKVEKLVSSERTFINKPTQIGYYEHPKFDDLADMDDYRRLIGAYKGLEATLKN